MNLYKIEETPVFLSQILSICAVKIIIFLCNLCYLLCTANAALNGKLPCNTSVVAL